MTAGPSRRTPAQAACVSGDSRRAEFARYAAVGAPTTVAYLLLYRLLADTLGAQTANMTALLCTTVVSTVLHRHVTFPRSCGKGPVRQQAEGALAMGITMVLTYVTLAALHGSGAGQLAETAGLLAATTLAGLARYKLLRAWVFAPAKPALR